MPAYTTVLGLYKPGGGSTGQISPDEAVDIDKINGNFDKLDSAVGLVTWTTSTRPASPFKNQQGYNSTLDIYEKWSGTAWVNALPTYLQSATLGKSYFTQSQLTGGALDSRYFTQSQLLTGGKLNSVYASKAAENQLNEYIDFSSHVTPASGWAVKYRLILKRRAGFLMQLDASLTRTGGALTGNLVNVRMLTLDGGYGSSAYQGLTSGPAGYSTPMYVQATGVYIGSTAGPGVTINTGDEVTVAGLWIQS